jgi:hypothetical protein
MTNRMIEDLIIMATDFEEISARSPMTQKSPGTPSRPVIQQAPVSELDFEQVVKAAHKFVDGHFSGEARLSPIRPDNDVGYQFTVQSDQPAFIYKKVLEFTKSAYPTSHVRVKELPNGTHHAELRYPNDQAVISIASFSKDMSFKISAE